MLEEEAVYEIETRAHYMLACRVISLCAKATGRTFEEACETFEIPCLSDLLSNAQNREGYTALWEDAVGKAVLASEYIRASDVAIRVVADWGQSGLRTLIYVYEETDAQDD